MKTLTTIPQGSRAKRLEKRRVSIEIMIWSDLHGDMQQLMAAEGALRTPLNNLSLDYFLGAPFNIASYALLTHMLAHSHGLTVGELTMTSGDTHIYVNHLEQSALQLTRQPKALPRLEWLVEPKPSVFDYKYEDFKVVDYVAEPNIKAPIAK